MRDTYFAALWHWKCNVRSLVAVHLRRTVANSKSYIFRSPTHVAASHEEARGEGKRRIVLTEVEGWLPPFGRMSRGAVCRSDATVMSTNIYLIGCSPANVAAVLCGSDLGGARKKVSPAKILGGGQGERRASEGLVITHQHTLANLQFNL